MFKKKIIAQEERLLCTLAPINTDFLNEDYVAFSS